MPKIIHSMIRVLDQKKSTDFYNKAFNLSIDRKLELDDFSLIYLKNNESDFELELTINKGRKEAYNLGDGYGHIAFSVKNIEEEHQRLTNIGLSPKKIIELKKDNRTLEKLFFIEDPDGYKIEILQSK